MFHERVTRLQAELQARGVQAAALMPGPNLRYLTGLDFHLMERPTVGFFPAEGAPVFAVPGLEQAKFGVGSPLDYEVEGFTYSDEEGPAEAFGGAIDERPERHDQEVVHLRMRVAEPRLALRDVPNAVLQNADPIVDALSVRKGTDEIVLIRRAIG